ncbi:MAG TPA: hypothetical protein DG754_03675 [Bacteroidales bacterium]|jgi:sugar O-acyltransferase (sialic acid O-acetyltransferase NeuD family)|nr:hypothetical protein [Bacteroidales bacterium]
MGRKILLIGGFIEIVELCEENNIEIIGIVDPVKTQSFLSYPIIGTEENIEVWQKYYANYEVLITPDLPRTRKKLGEIYQNNGFRFYTLISRKANVSKSSKIGAGTVIQTGSNISSETSIGQLVKVNCNANIMHNVQIGSYTTIAPNAVLLGNVTIGEECYIGANATILPNITICNNVIIGAGTVVTRSIETPNTTFVGVPARQLKNRNQ